MASLHRSLATVVCLALTASMSSAESHSTRVCTTSNSSTARLPLHCPESHVIHVQYWLTSLSHKGDISRCNTNSDCASVRDNDNSNFATLCNGLQLCNDSIAVSAGDRCSNGTVPRYFQVEYECVPDTSTVSLCSDAMVTANSTSLYLKTPAFPRGNHASNTTCTCQVQGQGLSVTVLELLFTNDMPASLSISNSSAELWRYTFSVIVFNRDVIASATQTSLNISFHDRGRGRQMAWLRISSTSGPLSIGCLSNSVLTTTPQRASTTLTTSAATSANSYSTGTMDSTRLSTVDLASTQGRPPSTSVHPASSALSTETRTPLQSTPILARETTSANSCSCSCQDGQMSAAGNGTAAVAVLSVLCVLLAVALVFSNLYHLRGRLCRGRDPTYAMTQAPVPEDAGPYTELRIYENRAVAMADRGEN